MQVEHLQDSLLSQPQMKQKTCAKFVSRWKTKGEQTLNLTAAPAQSVFGVAKAHQTRLGARVSI